MYGMQLCRPSGQVLMLAFPVHACQSVPALIHQQGVRNGCLQRRVYSSLANIPVRTTMPRPSPFMMRDDMNTRL
jgi:hypothetical protein